jgi:putative transposase
MGKDSKKLDNVINIDQDQLTGHVGEIVRSTVEQTLNSLLDTEADRLCNASRYERSAGRVFS